MKGSRGGEAGGAGRIPTTIGGLITTRLAGGTTGGTAPVTPVGLVSSRKTTTRGNLFFILQ